MITKTAREVYNNAQVLSQTYNTDFLTFQSAISFINDKYRQLYDKIVNSDSDFYIEEYVIDSNDMPLPCDLYNIKTVRFLSDIGDSFTPINRCPEKSYVPGTYTITNNIFHYNGDVIRPIQIRYNPVPKTITMPFDSEEIDIDFYNVKSFGKMYKDGIYYTDSDDNKFFYDFDNRSSTVAEKYHESDTEGYIVDYDEQTVFDKNNNDLSDNYTIYGKFTKIFFDDPYSMAEYEDGSIYVFTDHCGSRWNLNAVTGHNTTGNIFGLFTDDSTGFGCVYYNPRDDKLYHAPFVTDTIMSYTNNTLFYLLEVQLAILLASLNGTENEVLAQEESIAMEAFHQEVRQNKSGPLRVNNIALSRRFI